MPAHHHEFLAHRRPHGSDHRQWHAQAFEKRPTPLIAALVELDAHEFVQQVAVGAMQLDSIEAGLPRVPGRQRETGDGLRISSSLISAGVA